MKKIAVSCYAHRCMALNKVLYPPKWVGQPAGQGLFCFITMNCVHASGLSVLHKGKGHMLVCAHQWGAGSGQPTSALS